MNKIIEFGSAYDKRSDDPGKNYGIHGVDIRFVLKGNEGAVQFLLFTNWYLPHVIDEMISKPENRTSRMIKLFFMPIPADLGYHSKKPRYESQEPISDNCEYTDGVCYYDGSSLNAEPIYQVLLKEGSDGVWRKLEEYYKSIFNEDYPRNPSSPTEG